MQPLSLKTFKKRVASNKRKMRMFLTRLKKTPPKTLDQWAVTTEPTYLLKDRTGDWMNVKQPCQFLDMKTHKCSIYAVRPSDCSGFPHLSKKKVEEYIHVHHQNIEFCPATFNMVERMMQQFK